MDTARSIERVQSDLRRNTYDSESAVRQGAILPILQALGWPIFDTHIVAPEYSVEGRRVDFALCHPENKPVVFVEVKDVGNAGGADKQLFEYVFHQGVQMAVLTDGREWHFYLPAERGNYEDRKVHKLDLLERQTAECVQRFDRYLSYDAICSGAAIGAAREDYENVAREREILSALPDAWHRLTEEPDDLLQELLAIKVEDICGYKPSAEVCARFIREATTMPTASPVSRPVTPVAPASPRSSSQRRTLTQMGFVLDGVSYPCRSAREVVTELLRALAKRDPSFLDRVAERCVMGRRRLIAHRSDDLYSPDASQSVKDRQMRLVPGWYMGTCYGRKDYGRFVKDMSEVAGLSLGRDLVVNLRP